MTIVRAVSRLPSVAENAEQKRRALPPFDFFDQQHQISTPHINPRKKCQQRRRHTRNFTMSLPNSVEADNGNNDSLDPSFALGASDNDTTSFFHQQFSPTASNNINSITNGPPSHQYPVVAAPQSFSAAPIQTNPSMAPQAQQGPTVFSAQTAAILARAKQNIANHAGSASYEAAREQIMKGMVTSDQLPVPASGNTPKRGRGGRARGGRGGGAARSPTAGDGSTPGSTSAPASERGRGKVGRPRGRGRGGVRGGKRKRSESPELSDVSKSLFHSLRLHAFRHILSGHRCIPLLSQRLISSPIRATTTKMHPMSRNPTRRYRPRRNLDAP